MPIERLTKVAFFEANSTTNRLTIFFHKSQKKLQIISFIKRVTMTAMTTLIIMETMKAMFMEQMRMIMTVE